MQHRSTCIVESSEEVGQAFVDTWCSESGEGTAFPFFGLSVLNQYKILRKNAQNKVFSQACMFSVHFSKQGSKTER